MKRPDQKIKRKFDAWLGTLLYHAAQGQADSGVFGERLESIVAPQMPPDAVREAARDALAQMPLWEDLTDLKGEVLKRCTPQRMTEGIGLVQELLAWQPTANDSGSQTIGDLVRGWAELTRQDSGEFEERLYPKLVPLVAEWQCKTNYPGFTEEAVFQHPQEVGEFMAGLIKVFLEETPQAKLVGLMSVAMSAITETPSADVEAGLQDALREGCAFTAWRTSRQLGDALEANPQVKAALSTPEVAALVEYEEQGQGWGGDADKAVELLEGSLGTQLQEQIRGRPTKAALLNALKSAGRRSLLNNLMDAVKGHLSGRLIEIAVRWWLQKGGKEELNLICRFKESGRSPLWNGFWKNIWRR